ncbi:MAG: hypothetical protein HKN30_05495 [Sulfitobacter sp.]|nr:hypothetical protein [Sulfitobacter sp.]
MTPDTCVASALSALKGLNAFTSDRALRRYQLTVAQTGVFACPCPQTGKACTPVAHYLLPGQGVFYLFEGAAPFVVIAASLKDGFPLLCLATEDDVFWTGRPERTDLVAQAQSLLQRPPGQFIDPEQGPVVHIGDPNFAHCLWNEFPALNALSKRNHSARIAVHFDPLGILTRHCEVFAHEYRLADNRQALRGWSTAPVTMIGSTFCDTAARNAALALMGLQQPEKDPHTPRIWITLRDRGRTMENQLEFHHALITALSARHPRAQFLLDGFSTPADLDRPLYDSLRERFAARIAGGQKIARALMQNLPKVPIRDLTGMPLDQALSAAAGCHFYVAHAGTMQHKPAWLFPVRGIVHGNRASLSHGALTWCASMVAGSLSPAGLSQEIIQDSAVRGLPTLNDRNRDYFVTDIPRAVDEVLAHFEGVLLQDVSPRMAAN